jgi:aspartate 1-decarboxylase
MLLTLCKGKLHRLTVTQAELNYEGSITIAADLLDAAGILQYEKVQVVNVDNGARLETYTYAGPRGSGMVCLNGAAARQAAVGDRVIVIAYAQMSPEEAAAFEPRLVLVGSGNRVKEVVHQAVGEPQGHRNN